MKTTTPTMPGFSWLVRRVDERYCYETTGIIAVRRARRPDDFDSEPPPSEATASRRMAYDGVMRLPWDAAPAGALFLLPPCPRPLMRGCAQCVDGECDAVEHGYECDRSEEPVPVRIPGGRLAIRSDVLRYLISLGARDAEQVAVWLRTESRTVTAFRSVLTDGIAIWMPQHLIAVAQPAKEGT